MRNALLACFVVAFSILAALAHAVITDPKPPKVIEIIHAPRVLMAGSALGFQVRIRGAIDEDRQVFAMLCEQGAACALAELQHERFSQLPIEGSAAPKLWPPKAWTHIPAGDYLLVAGIGPVGAIRVSDSLTITVQGF